MKNKKALLICSKSQSVLTFRRGIIKALQEANFDVSVLVFDSESADGILELGVSLNVIEDDNRSLNPFKILSLRKRIAEVIKKESPDFVFTFMLKPNIFGVLAAKSAGIKSVFSMVEGVGDVYTRTGLKWGIIRMVVSQLYRKSFKYSKKIIFLNEDNKREFIERGIVKDDEKIMIVPGIGVDKERFEYTPINNYDSILMIARLLKTKGVFEYCNAARILKKKYPTLKFKLLGPEAEITKEDLKEYIANNDIEYYPPTNDVLPYLKECAIYVLPSYKEGLSMSIMEAESVGRAIVTSNTVGCVDSIKKDVNGYLAKVGSAEDLASTIERLIENKERIKKFGEASRRLVEEKFDQKIINKKIISLINRELES